METPKVQVFSRSGASTDSPKPQEAPEPKPSISWRKISLLGTPLLIGVLNLIEAHWEKKTAFTNGQLIYEKFVGEGKEVLRLAPEQGHIVGKKRKQGMIDEAEGHAKGVVAGARSTAAGQEDQGRERIPVPDLQAQKTMALMKPQHDVVENLLHIVRLTLMKNESIVIAVPEVLSKTSFSGRGKNDFSSAELMRRVNTMGRLVEAAAVSRSQEDLSVRPEARFLGCR